MKTITYSIYYPPTDIIPGEYIKIVNRANKILSKILRFNKKLKLLEITEEPYRGELIGPPKLISEIKRGRGDGVEVLTSSTYVASILKIVYQTDAKRGEL